MWGYLKVFVGVVGVLCIVNAAIRFEPPVTQTADKALTGWLWHQATPDKFIEGIKTAQANNSCAMILSYQAVAVRIAPINPEAREVLVAAVKECDDENLIEFDPSPDDFQCDLSREWAKSFYQDTLPDLAIKYVGKPPEDFTVVWAGFWNSEWTSYWISYFDWSGWYEYLRSFGNWFFTAPADCDESAIKPLHPDAPDFILLGISASGVLASNLAIPGEPLTRIPEVLLYQLKHAYVNRILDKEFIFYLGETGQDVFNPADLYAVIMGGGFLEMRQRWQEHLEQTRFYKLMGDLGQIAKNLGATGEENEATSNYSATLLLVKQITEDGDSSKVVEVSAVYGPMTPAVYELSENEPVYEFKSRSPGLFENPSNQLAALWFAFGIILISWTAFVTQRRK